MTNSQLYHAVAQLGFEDSIEYEDGYTMAANRALLQVASLRPQVRSLTINHSPLKNLITGADFAPVLRTEDLIYEATSPRSYYFEVCGAVVVRIQKQNGDGSWSDIGAVLDIDVKSFTAYRGFIKDNASFVSGRVRLLFSGEYACTVRCVAMYGGVFSSDVEDIPPYVPYTVYDISKLAPDFLSLGMPPIKEESGYAYLSSGYDIENGRIIHLPYSAPGLYKIWYNHMPEKIGGADLPATDDIEIDLDEEMCALLPILVAAYIWLDDEPEKAQYYLALYRERAAEFKASLVNMRPAVIRDVYGW